MFDRVLKFFIENSRMNYTLFFLIFAVGIWSYNKIPKEIFPTFELDKVSISGAYSGASIDTLDKIAVNDIEDGVKSLNGVDEVNSVIKAGSFSITIDLQKGQNRYEMTNKIKDIVSNLQSNLPSDMNEPTVVAIDRQKDLLEISISSDKLSTDQLKPIADKIKSKILNISNISEVVIYGDSDKFYEVIFDDKKIKAYNLDINTVYNTLSSAYYTFPLGLMEGKQHFYLSLDGGAKGFEDFKNSKLNLGNVSCYLKDIASIKKRYEDGNTMFSINGKNSLNIVVVQSEDGNAITISKGIQKVLDKESKKFDNVEFTIRDDASEKIQDRLNIVISNIIFGILVITLIVMLLINSRMAFVIMLGIPTSFVIAAFYFYLFGYTINMISLIGVLIALGIVVDDAMVVAENIQQKIEQGLDKKEAALKGASEMAKPVFIASITTLFAFLPALMISGTMGEVIRLIPIALSALIVASLIESFIFLPIHAMHTLSPTAKTLSWSRINGIYSSIIHFLLRWRKTFLVLFIVLVPVFTVMVLKKSKFQMFPSFDATTIDISMKMDVNTKLEDGFDIVKKIEKDILDNKDRFYIDTITATAGFRKSSAGSSERYPYVMSIKIELQKLKPQNFADKYITPYLSFYYDDEGRVRDEKSQDISKDLRVFLKQKDYKKLYNLDEIEIVEGRVGPVKSDIRIGLSSDDYSKIQKSIAIIETELSKIDGIKSISDSAKDGISELKVKINSYGSDLGVDEGYLGTQLSNLYLSKKKANIFDKEGLLELRVESLYKDDIEELKNLEIKLKDGNIVLLKDIATLVEVKSSQSVRKEEGERYFYLYSNVDPRVITATEVLQKISPAIDNIKKMGVKIKLKGEAEKKKALKADMIAASSLAMVLIMLSMLYLFNSFRRTFIVMSVIPFSFLGVLLGHILMDVNLSMPSMIGALGLAGVVINDGIIMMTYLSKAKTLEEVFEASARRFRPIILTSVTTLIGLISLIFFPTGQAVIFQPLAISLGFGLLWGTILNLIYLPVMYSVVYRIKN